MDNKWQEIINHEKEKPYFKELSAFVSSEYDTQTVYPPKELIYNALEQVAFNDIKCVILGQDPYHGPNQAMGLSFSVNKGVTIPRSLKNIYKELQNEFGYDIPSHGDLSSWAEQGVLLLNTVLTVREGDAGSHQGKGWEQFTDAILQAINDREEPVVYLLWGNEAKKKKELLNNPNHCVLEAAHPSPFAANRGFFGCNHFTLCNEFLVKNNMSPIDWKIL